VFQFFYVVCLDFGLIAGMHKYILKNLQPLQKFWASDGCFEAIHTDDTRIPAAPVQSLVAPAIGARVLSIRVLSISFA
jgi:hypothetical protein